MGIGVLLRFSLDRGHCGRFRGLFRAEHATSSRLRKDLIRERAGSKCRSGVGAGGLQSRALNRPYATAELQEH